jgi:hypothetical protein
LIEGCSETAFAAILKEANDEDYRREGGDHTTMTDQQRKMSEVLEEMSKLLLRHPRKVPSAEAAQVALFFANAAWNECVGLTDSREGFRHVWETIESENPELWNEFKSNDINAMIDELVEYKGAHYPNDQRRILTCGIAEGRIRVEWLGPAAPGMDSRWEMQLYGLVRTGKRQEAIRFLQQTRAMSRREAEARVAEITARLGMA